VGSSSDVANDLTATAAALLVSLSIMGFILFLVNQRRVRYWAARLTR
jgi:hypothetical protein